MWGPHARAAPNAQSTHAATGLARCPAELDDADERRKGPPGLRICSPRRWFQSTRPLRTNTRKGQARPCEGRAESGNQEMHVCHSRQASPCSAIKPPQGLPDSEHKWRGRPSPQRWACKGNGPLPPNAPAFPINDKARMQRALSGWQRVRGLTGWLSETVTEARCASHLPGCQHSQQAPSALHW